MKQVTNTEEAHTMKAKVTRTKIAVAAGIAVLAAGLATPLAGASLPNKRGCSGSTSACAMLDS